MEVRVQKILGKKVNRQQNIWPKSMCYAGGVQTYMRVVEGNVSTEHSTRNLLLEQISSPANINAADKQVKSNMCSDWIDRMWCDRLLGYLLGQVDALIMAICQRIYCHNYLNVGMIVGSQVEPIRVGMSLDGSLHPLKTTILLNESDVELSARTSFVRYA